MQCKKMAKRKFPKKFTVLVANSQRQFAEMSTPRGKRSYVIVKKFSEEI